MTGFTIGLIAAAIWVSVALGLWYLYRHTPRHPFRSIGDFRRVRRKLAEPIAEPDPAVRLVAPPEYAERSVNQVEESASTPSGDDEVMAEERKDYPVPDDQLSLFRPQRATPTEEQPSDETELHEINEVIESVTSAERPRRKTTAGRTQSNTARKRTAAADKPIRKIGRFTYVTVDEEGKPQADPR